MSKFSIPEEWFCKPCEDSGSDEESSSEEEEPQPKKPKYIYKIIPKPKLTTSSGSDDKKKLSNFSAVTEVYEKKFETGLMPQNNAKDIDHIFNYKTLEFKLGLYHFKFLYEAKIAKDGSFANYEKQLQDYKVSIGAKLECVSCRRFRFDMWYQDFSEHWCECGYHAGALTITITNIGEAATFCMNLKAKLGGSLLNATEYLENNEEYEWSIEGIGNGEINNYFSTSGDIAIICDIDIQEKENEMEIDNSICPSQKLATKFTESNINPTSPPDNLFTDIILLVDKNRIYCHRLVLGMYSNFFERMFLSGMKESQRNEVNLKDVDLETVKNLIYFMYTGRIDNEKINVSLLVAADMYEVMSLRSICIQELSKSVNFDNCKEIWQTGILLDNEKLVNTTTVFMVKNWKKLSEDDGTRALCMKYPDLALTVSRLQAKVIENCMDK